MIGKRLLFVLLFCCEVAFATHIIGGNLRTVQNGSNDFTVSLNLYRDCAPGNAPVDASYTLLVLDAVTLNPVFNTLLIPNSRDTVELSTLCFIPRNLCIEEYVFTADINLADNPNGYLLFTQTCCRNGIINNISNPGSAGIVWSMEIPDPALAGGNNSPNLRIYPSDGFLCANYELTIDFSATDTDGDSLSYRLVEPYDNTQPLAPPFPTVNWLFGYSAQTPITGIPGLTIDVETGIATCKANQFGIYVLAYEVQEFRNGRLIGSVRRDIQVQVLGCTIDIPPTIISPIDSIFTFALGEQQCITLSAIDSNVTDTISLTYSINSNAPSTSLVKPTSGKITGIGKAETEICWEPNCTDLLGGQEFTIVAKLNYSGCVADSSIKKTFVYGIDQTIPKVTAILPNVFTPNGDGIGEVLKPLVAIEERCAGKLNISIFNRWGQLMYTDFLINLNWDGRVEGKVASEGVYFYTVSGTYASEATSLKGYFTLIR